MADPQRDRTQLDTSTRPTMDDREQSQAFIEKARELGCEANLGRLDDALRRIAKAGPAPREAVKRPRKKGAEPE